MYLHVSEGSGLIPRTLLYMLGAVGDVAAGTLSRNTCVLMHECVHLCWSGEGPLRPQEGAPVR